MPPIDLSRARADTPGVGHVNHLNSAGASLPPAVVTDAVIDHLVSESHIGGYEAAAAAAERVEATYRSVSRLIGSSPDEVAMVDSATVAWDMAFYGMKFAPGDRILTAKAEYASNMIAFLQVRDRTGAVVEVVDDDEQGQLSVEDLRRRISDGKGPVRLIAMTHVPTNSGLINPAEEVGAIARDVGIPYLLDACQSVGQLNVDVGRIGCDMLSATGRKYLRGPRGTGFLYVSKSMLGKIEPPFLDLRAATWTAEDQFSIREDARRFESWEHNVAARIGLGVAVDYALGWGIDAIQARVLHLADTLRAFLRDIDGVIVHDVGEHLCGIVTFTVAGSSPEEVKDRLARERISVSVSSLEQAGPYLHSRGLEGLVRASVHYYNTEDELGALCSALPRGST